MKLKPETPSKAPDISDLSAAELRSMVEGLQQELATKNAEVQHRNQAVKQRDQYIQILEELLRWKRVQQFGASSEKSAHQIHLFDEAELEAEIDDLRDQLPDDVKEEEATLASRKRRQRGFSDKLLRERIELTLSDEDKAGASKTFFTKVKEELQSIPWASAQSPPPCWLTSLPRNTPMAYRSIVWNTCSSAWAMRSAAPAWRTG
jgi:small-conductance mechanosensitive channel